MARPPGTPRLTSPQQRTRLPPPAAVVRPRPTYRRSPGLWLDRNECTRPASDRVREAVARFVAGGGFNWYADPEARALRRRLARYTGRSVGEIQVFNGSDAALEHLVRAFVKAGDHVLLSAPCYDQVRVLGEALGARVELSVAGDPFRADVGCLVRRLEPRTRIVYLCNPNNPTGRTYSLRDLARLARAIPAGLLVVDEAYFEFMGRTAARLLDAHPNLVVTRSFSKAFGLAGLRIGYLLARRPVMRVVERIRNGKDVGAVAQVAAAAALDDLGAMRAHVRDVAAARRRLVRALRAGGHTVVEAPANFVLLRAADPAGLVRRLLRRGVSVRDQSAMPGLGPWVRVTVGSHDECARFLAALESA